MHIKIMGARSVLANLCLADGDPRQPIKDCLIGALYSLLNFPLSVFLE